MNAQTQILPAGVEIIADNGGAVITFASNSPEAQAAAGAFFASLGGPVRAPRQAMPWDGLTDKAAIVAAQNAFWAADLARAALSQDEVL